MVGLCFLLQLDYNDVWNRVRQSPSRPMNAVHSRRSWRLNATTKYFWLFLFCRMFKHIASVFLVQTALVGVWTRDVHISHTITQDVMFYHRRLTHTPSLSATVEFSVSYSNISFCSTAHARCGPKMDIYTTQKDVNFKKNCSYDSFGQAGNERLVIYLSELDPSNPIHQTSSKTCTLLPGEHQRVQCSGKVTVQDFIPRNLFISLGYKCKHTSKLAKMPSLYGMQLNISVLNQSNTTACEKIVS